MSSKIIIVTTLVLVLICFLFLFTVEEKNNDYDFKKNWSVVYFDNPSGNSLQFTIENHQKGKINYGYKILKNDKLATEGSVEVEKAEKKVLSPNIGSGLAGSKITIIINTSEREYKIYKNIK